jgi:hypothetical protein
MYRDPSAELRSRLAARYAELQGSRGRADQVIGVSTDSRKAVVAAFAALDKAHFMSAELETLTEVERSLDLAEQALAACFADALNVAPFVDAMIAAFGPLGPNTSALSRAHFRTFPPQPGHAETPAIALAEAAHRWLPQLPVVALVQHEPALSKTIFFFEWQSIPFRLQAAANVLSNKLTAEEWLVKTTLVARRPRVHPLIGVRPQRVGDDVLQMLGISRDVTFDDAEFDPRYFVTGDEAPLRAELTPAVRQAFVTAYDDYPATVQAANGFAVLEIVTQRLNPACALLAAFARASPQNATTAPAPAGMQDAP